MLKWQFMGQIAIGAKSIPKSMGPETFSHIPKFPETDPGLIYKTVFLRFPLGRRYFPDWKAEFNMIIANYLNVVGRFLVNPGELNPQGNQNPVDTFEEEHTRELLDEINIPEIDRDYCFAVMVYLFPGMLTALLRAAHNRHAGNDQHAHNGVAFGHHQEGILMAEQGLAPKFNNKALKHLQRAFGRLPERDIANIDRETQRLDGSIKATRAYCCTQILTAFDGKNS
jgi:hypothetical protein